MLADHRPYVLPARRVYPLIRPITSVPSRQLRHHYNAIKVYVTRRVLNSLRRVATVMLLDKRTLYRSALRNIQCYTHRLVDLL
jgi:hypothetical protein